MKRVLVLCLLVAVATSNPVTKFKDCGSVNGKINSLDVTPCPSFPCQFQKGKYANVTIHITASTPVTSAKTVVHSIINTGGHPVPFQIASSDACATMRGCPVNNGAEVTYKDAIFVHKTLPNIHLVVKWEIQDQTGKDLICFEVPVEITD